jgi:hypothetical protein
MGPLDKMDPENILLFFNSVAEQKIIGDFKNLSFLFSKNVYEQSVLLKELDSLNKLNEGEASLSLSDTIDKLLKEENMKLDGLVELWNITPNDIYLLKKIRKLKTKIERMKNSIIVIKKYIKNIDQLKDKTHMHVYQTQLDISIAKFLEIYNTPILLTDNDFLPNSGALGIMENVDITKENAELATIEANNLESLANSDPTYKDLYEQARDIATEKKIEYDQKKKYAAEYEATKNSKKQDGNKDTILDSDNSNNPILNAKIAYDKAIEAEKLAKQALEEAATLAAKSVLVNSDAVTEADSRAKKLVKDADIKMFDFYDKANIAEQKNADEINVDKNFKPLSYSDVKRKYLHLFNKKNIGILKDKKVQQQIINKLKTQKEKDFAEAFFKNYFNKEPLKITDEFKNEIANMVNIETVGNIFSIAEQLVSVMEESTYEQLIINKLEESKNRKFDETEKKQLKEHIHDHRQKQILDESTNTKVKTDTNLNPIFDTYIECLINGNNSDINCYVPTVETIAFQTVSKVAIELAQKYLTGYIQNLVGGNGKIVKELVEATYTAIDLGTNFEQVIERWEISTANRQGINLRSGVQARIVEIYEGKRPEPTRGFKNLANFHYDVTNPQTHLTIVRRLKPKKVIVHKPIDPLEIPPIQPEGEQDKQEESDEFMGIENNGVPIYAKVLKPIPQVIQHDDIVKIGDNYYRKKVTKKEIGIESLKKGEKDEGPIDIKDKKLQNKLDETFKSQLEAKAKAQGLEEKPQTEEGKHKSFSKNEVIDKPTGDGKDKSVSEDNVKAKDDVNKVKLHVVNKKIDVVPSDDSPPPQLKGFKQRLLHKIKNSRPVKAASDLLESADFHLHKIMAPVREMVHKIKSWYIFDNQFTKGALKFGKYVMRINGYMRYFSDSFGKLTTNLVKNMANFAIDSIHELAQNIILGAERTFAQNIILNASKKFRSKVIQGAAEVTAQKFEKFISNCAHNFLIDTVADLVGDKESTLNKIVKGTLGIVNSIADVFKKIDLISSAKDTILNWSANQLMINLGISLVDTMSNFASAILNTLPDEPLQAENQQHREQVANAIITGEKIITPFADAISGLLEPGGLSRFVYIMYNSGLNAQDYLVIGQPGASQPIVWLKDKLGKGVGASSMVIASILDPIIAIGKEIPGIIKSAITNLGTGIIGILQSIIGIFDVFAGSNNFISGIRTLYSSITTLGLDLWNSVKNIYEVIKIASLRTADIFLTGSWLGENIMNWLIPYENTAYNSLDIRTEIKQYLHQNMHVFDSGIYRYYTLQAPSYKKDNSQIFLYYDNMSNVYNSPPRDYYKIYTELDDDYIYNWVNIKDKIKVDHPELYNKIQEWQSLKQDAELKSQNKRYEILKNFQK